MALVGGASGALLQFLEQNRSSLQREDLLEQLTSLTVQVLSDSNDSGLLDLLQRCGWDILNKSYDAAVEIENLSRGLAKLNQRRHNRGSTLRASHVGIRNTIKSFAPDMLMKYTLERGYGDNTISTPFSVFFEGVVLLADISGFTRLSGQYCDRGKDGIDQLQQATNGYMGQLVKVIYAYGGDVMKFAGDALVCIFEPNKHNKTGAKSQSLRDACANAVQCGFELAQVCTDQLTAHVAVSCGAICFATLGGYGNLWECLVSGECLGHLSQCLDDAPSKHTVITQQCVNILGTNYLAEIDLEQLPTGNYRVVSTARMNSLVTKIIKRRAQQLMKDCESRFMGFPNDSDFLTQIGRFVPTPVSMGLLSGNFDYLAELREVTTMFMKWDGYDEDVHHDLITLQPHFFATQKVLAESGAFLRQFLVDDKGCVLIACWGVPTASYPDNARRALCSAVIIGAELWKLGMQTSFGITTGNVFCGSVGSFVRREYAAIGDVVNLAARLMGKAKGGCLVSEVTFNRLPQYLKPYLEKLAPMTVKGKDVPIIPYKYSSPDILSLDESTYHKNLDDLRVRAVCKKHMVEELEVLAKSHDRTELKFLLFEGGVGTGKEEAVEWMKLNGPKLDIRVVCVRLSTRDTWIDFGVLSKLFRLLVGEDIFDHPERQQMIIRHILREVYGGDKQTIELVALPAMRAALGVSCTLADVNQRARGEGKKAHKLPPRLLKQSLHDVFSYLFNEGPVVCVIEDAHFADQSSWQTLMGFGDILSRGLFLLTQTPAEQLEESYIQDISSMSGSGSSAAGASSSKNGTTSQGGGVSGAMGGEVPTTETVPMPEWLAIIRKKLSRMPNFSIIQLSDLTVTEVGHVLCTVLAMPSCPAELADMVHKLSGGNPYWCREMAMFIQSTGAEEFMRTLKVTATVRRVSDARVGRIGPHVDLSSVIQKEGKGGPPVALLNGMSEWVPSKRLQSQASTAAKLEVFIVCRFEKLSTEDQSVLRTASMIGIEFSKDILYGILSPKMRTRMFNALQSLVRGHWVHETGETGAEYAFTHALVYQTLYDLTPTSDKARLHFAIASYVEDAFEGKPEYFSSLGHHYGLSHDCHAKALEYTVRAAAYRFDCDVTYMDEALSLISESKKYAEAAVDFASILGVMKEGKEKLSHMKKVLKDAPALAAKAAAEEAARAKALLTQEISPSDPRTAPPAGNEAAGAPSSSSSGGGPSLKDVLTNGRHINKIGVETPQAESNNHSPRSLIGGGNIARPNTNQIAPAPAIPVLASTATEANAGANGPPGPAPAAAAAVPANPLRSADGKLTMKGVLYYLAKIQALEDEIYESYEKAVELNNIGIIAEWMKPYLSQRRKTLRDSWAGNNKKKKNSRGSHEPKNAASGMTNQPSYSGGRRGSNGLGSMFTRVNRLSFLVADTNMPLMRQESSNRLLQPQPGGSIGEGGGGGGYNNRAPGASMDYQRSERNPGSSGPNGNEKESVLSPVVGASTFPGTVPPSAIGSKASSPRCAIS